MARQTDAPRQGHTQGPWEAYSPPRDSGTLGAVRARIGHPTGSTSVDVADCYGREANARLIAAAPEMLEALRDAYWALKGAGKVGDADAIRAAIRKAEGGE